MYFRSNGKSIPDKDLLHAPKRAIWWYNPAPILNHLFLNVKTSTSIRNEEISMLGSARLSNQLIWSCRISSSSGRRAGV